MQENLLQKNLRFPRDRMIQTEIQLKILQYECKHTPHFSDLNLLKEKRKKESHVPIWFNFTNVFFKEMHQSL